MKITSFLIVFSTILSLTQSVFASRIFPLKPQYAFTPKGFDSNDNAQVILAGAFGDYCMQVGSTQHKVDFIQKKIYIQQTYSTNQNCNDLEMYLPYTIEVNLGPLPEGTYEILVMDTDKKYTLMSTLPISAAKKSTVGQTDELLYAPVNSIEFKNSGTTPQLRIKGVFTNTCLSLASIEVHARMGDIFEVLPIASDRKSNCHPSLQAFTKTVDLPGFSQRNTLIHVRSMNGQAINKVITTLDRLKN